MAGGSFQGESVGDLARQQRFHCPHQPAGGHQRSFKGTGRDVGIWVEVAAARLRLALHVRDVLGRMHALQLLGRRRAWF